MRFNLRVQSKWCQSPSDTSWLMNTPFDPKIKSKACQTINNWNCIKGLYQGWPVHFVYKAIYESLFAMELEKLLVNDKVTASCQTNWSRSQVCYDGDDNENVKRAIGWIGKATPLHVQHGFLYISLPSLHDYDGKMPYFTFYGGRKQTTWTWMWSLGIRLKKSSLAFDKVNELEQSR